MFSWPPLWSISSRACTDLARPTVGPAAFTNPDAAQLAKDAEQFAAESGIPQVERSWQYMTDALGQHLPAAISRAKSATARINRLR